jgi:hypothetical protein
LRAPSPREPGGNPGLAFDPLRRRVVLVADDTAWSRRDTWTWNGESWSMLRAATTQGAEPGQAMFWDGARERVTSFDGTRFLLLRP